MCLLQRQIGEDHREKTLFEDWRGGVTGAHTYFYADEAKCDKHMETFIKCIKASGGSSMDGFTAIKMTALGRPQFLLQFSEVLAKWRQFFAFLESQQGGEGMQALEQRLELQQLQALFILQRPTHSFLSSLGELEPLLQKFNNEEEKQMERMLQCMDTLVKKAYDNVTMDVELSRHEGWHFAAKLAYMYQEREWAGDLDYEDPINPDYESTNIMCLDYVLVVDCTQQKCQCYGGCP
ncbi:hypothetical protein KUCAC02_028748 [Chaenocephalus aceratus]|uniref:Uncharacterized protein n=1 Tax=Chaenocephalus aceratus TaxID=36190 RepID=A0ACB9X3I1_CHAAC|nr:hypothetical protein KUCAC02_028748 [Chaenocephalus aceratus]